jgi:hypothetical protein
MPCLFLLSAVLTFLTSACMWGVVRDATTGAPIANSVVAVQDSQGNTRVTTTNEFGVYYFDQSGPSLALGDATFFASSPTEGSQSERHKIDYGENPNATFADPMSFWDVQVIHVPGQAGLYHDQDQRFSITFPNTWIVMPAGPPNMSALYSNVMAMGMDNATINECQVESDQMPPGGLPSPHDWRNAPSDITVKHVSSDQIAGTTATVIVASFKSQDRSMPGDVDADMWVFGHDQQYWLIICATTPANFTNEGFAYSTIAKSFKFDQ